MPDTLIMSTEDTIIDMMEKQKQKSKGKLCEILLEILSERAFRQDKYAIDLLKEAQKALNEKESPNQ